MSAARWSGKVSASTGWPAHLQPAAAALVLEEVHARLASVVIDCLPWRTFVERYDRPGMLFYLDPPYWGTEAIYGARFDRAEFDALADLLAGLKGRFILSLNDRPETRRLFARFRVDRVGVLYRVSSGVTPARELIIEGP